MDYEEIKEEIMDRDEFLTIEEQIELAQLLSDCDCYED